MAEKKKNPDLEKLLKEQRKNLSNKLKEKMTKKTLTPEEIERRDEADAKMKREVKKLGLSAKNLREKKNMTMQEMADKCGLSLDTIYRFENGDPESKFNTMILISIALGISLFYLAKNSDVIEP